MTKSASASIGIVVIMLISSIFAANCERKAQRAVSLGGGWMSRYFMHLKEFTGELLQDLEGSELPDLAAASEHALLSLRELVAHNIAAGSELRFEAILILDDRGAQLAAIPVIAALPSSVIELLRRPAALIPSIRFEEYRSNAANFLNRAADASRPSDKISWLDLADAWLQMLPRSAASTALEWPEAIKTDSKASH